MASIQILPNRRFWFAMYRDAEGRQHCVSTKIEHTPLGKDASDRAQNAAKNKRLATEMANKLEEAERGNTTETHLRKILADISQRVNQRRIEFAVTKTFLDDWLARAKMLKSHGTYERYRGIVENFLTILGAKASAALSDITPQDVQNFISRRLDGGRNPSTVRTDIKILNVPFGLAVRQGLILTNPVAATELPDGAKESRAPFTVEQVQTLMRAAEDLASEEREDADLWREWGTAIRLGFYTGQRLGDCVVMAMPKFDFEQHVMRIRPQKTSRKKRDLVIPLHPELEEYVLKLAISDNQGLLCPILANRKVSGKYGLSIQFHRILAKARIEQETIEAKGAAGHSFHKYTFHSLRHTYVTELANAGIAPDVRKLLSGHSDDQSHATYTHTQLKTLRRAIDTLPRLSA